MPLGNKVMFDKFLNLGNNIQYNVAMTLQLWQQENPIGQAGPNSKYQVKCFSLCTCLLDITGRKLGL
jgi:hypothetical protein